MKNREIVVPCVKGYWLRCFQCIEDVWLDICDHQRMVVNVKK